MKSVLQSLRWRLLGGALLAVAAALAVAGWGIARLFAYYVTQQFDLRLHDHMTQVLAALQIDAQGVPVLGQTLADPRWERPYSGLYWQVQPIEEGDAEPVLRSWSLWDERLFVPVDGLTDHAPHRHEIAGPAGQRLRALERAVQWGSAGPWRVIVAADVAELESAQAEFRGALVGALLMLGAALLLAVAVQVRVGLQPLRELQAAVQRVREGRQARLQGRLPIELQPLVDEFNQVLADNEQGIERSRRLAGNLAHAIKTPLAVLAALADDATQPREALVQQLREQVEAVRRQVDWHLRRARAASASGPARRTPVAPVLEGLLRVMAKVHAPRDEQRAPLALTLDVADPTLCFAGEEQDLHEMAGNLLDNACKWARTRVAVSAQREQRRWRLVVDDDGPGLAPEQYQAVLQRGVRADERVSGTGLGLDIVRDIASLYGGELRLDRGPLGGLRAELWLPAI